jgi:predicted RNA-binding Zn ribbon-like protein
VRVSDGFQPGGRPAAPAPLDLVQDFVNTEIPDWNRDDVGSPEALATWLRERGLIEPHDDVGPSDFVAARTLRAALRELALANTLGHALLPERQVAVDRALGAFPLALRVGADGPAVGPGGSGAARGLAAIVAVVAAARTGGVWERLKACRQETCGWLFYDSSRNRSSNWCSMQVCGGREKARAYRRRHEDAT